MLNPLAHALKVEQTGIRVQLHERPSTVTASAVASTQQHETAIKYRLRAVIEADVTASDSIDLGLQTQNAYRLIMEEIFGPMAAHLVRAQYMVREDPKQAQVIIQEVIVAMRGMEMHRGF